MSLSLCSCCSLPLKPLKTKSHTSCFSLSPVQTCVKLYFMNIIYIGESVILSASWQSLWVVPTGNPARHFCGEANTGTKELLNYRSLASTYCRTEWIHETVTRHQLETWEVTSPPIPTSILFCLFIPSPWLVVGTSNFLSLHLTFCFFTYLILEQGKSKA